MKLFDHVVPYGRSLPEGAVLRVNTTVSGAIRVSVASHRTVTVVVVDPETVVTQTLLRVVSADRVRHPMRVVITASDSYGSDAR